LIVDCLKLLPPETVVHRLTGDGPKRLLITPLWSADKKRVLNTLSRKIREA
jgi:radical SAM superfamily enzyme